MDFEDLAKTDQNLGLLIQTVYKEAWNGGKQGADVTKLGKDIDFLQRNMSVASFDAKLSSAVDDFAAKLGPLEVSIMKAVEGKIAAADKSIGSRIKSLEATSEVVYWFDNHADPGEDESATYVNPGARPFIKLTGVGFESRYHPDARGQLKCEFIVTGKKNIVSVGSIVAKVNDAGAYYSVECQVPAYEKGVSAEMKLYEHDGTLIPFKGAPGCNKLSVEPQ